MAGGEAAVDSLSALRARLLAQRGIAAESAPFFFEPSFSRDVHDPLRLAQMADAVARLRRARQRGERVLVYGDYDADGVCGTALLLAALQALGYAAFPYLPHRIEDGYGLNHRVLERLLPEFDVLISVDCGISNAAEIDWLAARGRDAIVVDHHALPEQLPPALAILHPGLAHYPFPFLSGSGVAWKLAQALFADDGQHRHEEMWLLDLCCIGTIADMVPLLGENRALVWFGLDVLRRSQKPGVRQLLQQAGRGEELTAEVVSYRVAPLLNAAGRMDHPQPALDVLLCTQPSRAAELVTQLRRHNEERRAVSRRVQAEAERTVAADAPLAFAWSKHWPAGVVGLVAGRLSELFARPSVIIGAGGGHAVGSVRAPAGVNALELLEGVREHVLTLGGHARAAGFSVAWQDVAGLQAALLARWQQRDVHLREERAEAVIDTALISWETVAMLEQFRPYGAGNEQPTCIIRDVPLIDSRPVGKAGEHLKLRLVAGHEVVDGIGFGLANEPAVRALRPGEAVDVLGYLESNEFRGRRSLQIRIKDIAPSGEVRIVGEPTPPRGPAAAG